MEKSVYLRHPDIGLYYAGPKHWVSDLGSALNLSTIEHAAELCRDEPFEEMDVVLMYDDPTCELILPIRRKKPVKAEPLRVAA